jgi:hypothetical protein
MLEPRVRTFFYGSYMNPDVLREINLALEDVEVACLPGFDITIRPLANLVRADRDVVYGVVGLLSHAGLERLYMHAQEKLGGGVSARGGGGPHKRWEATTRSLLYRAGVEGRGSVPYVCRPHSRCGSFLRVSEVVHCVY